MKLVIASDHAGFNLKEEVRAYLATKGHEVVDLGVHSTEPSDYPDAAEAVGDAINAGVAKKGILICGSGVGVCVAANKIPGIRASVCHDSYSAHQGVEHDNMNILVFGARVIGSEVGKELARIFIAARFTGEARHVRRLAKIHAMEERYGMHMPAGSPGTPS